MSELNKIYEISQQLSSPNNFKNDINEIIELIQKHLMSKYLYPINSAVSSHREYCISHPCREVNLINAFRPFTENAKRIDDLINIINTIRLFNDMKNIPPNGMGHIKAASIKDSAIHSDGIYEIDKSCISTNQQLYDNGAGIDISSLLIIILLFIYLP